MVTETTLQDTIAGKAQNPRKEKLSKDGKWKSFPKVPHLLQYVDSGTYFARVRVNGKLKRQSLETKVFTDAKLKLGDFVKQEKTRKIPSYVHEFKDARLMYEQNLATSELAEGSKRYRQFCIKALLESWPGLDALPLHKLTERDCVSWADRFKSQKDAQYFNNILGTLRAILKLAGLTGADDPTREIKRRGVKRTLVQMPTPEQFQTILREIETAGARQSKDCADLVRFLAYSGCRLSEARKVQWEDIDLEGGWIRVENAKRRRAADSGPRDAHRFVPIVPPMRDLLARIRPATATGAVCRVSECEKSLTNACARAKFPRLTHHDLRHYFATVCAEKADPQTFSKWLGHSDGGALAMKTYCHPRKEYEKQLAAQIDFGGSK